MNKNSVDSGYMADSGLFNSYCNSQDHLSSTSFSFNDHSYSVAPEFSSGKPIILTTK